MQKRRTEWRPNRRTVLRQLLMGCTGGLLAACGLLPEDPHVAPWRPAVTHPILQSPQPAYPTEAAAETPQPEVAELEAFLALSALLTGVEPLNPVLGRVYLRALQENDQFTVSVPDLLEQAGFHGDAPPGNLDELTATGIFEQEYTRTLADTIAEYWYTGIYETAEGEPAVATFTDALAWQVLTFTKPLTVCGAPGFWEERPQIGDAF